MIIHLFFFLALSKYILLKLLLFYCIAVNEDMLVVLAHQKYKAGNYKQALEHSNSVYERNPQRTDNLLLLGAIHYQVVSEISNVNYHSFRFLKLFPSSTS